MSRLARWLHKGCAPIGYELLELCHKEKRHENAHRHRRRVEGQPQHIHFLLQHLGAHAMSNQFLMHSSSWVILHTTLGQQSALLDTSPLRPCCGQWFVLWTSLTVPRKACGTLGCGARLAREAQHSCPTEGGRHSNADANGRACYAALPDGEHHTQRQNNQRQHLKACGHLRACAVTSAPCLSCMGR